MRQIADGAGTSIGNLYFYFANKEDLLDALLSESREAAWAWIDQTIPLVPPGPARMVVTVYGNALGLLGADRTVTRMLLRESERPELADRIAALYEGRICQALRDNFPDYPETDLNRAAIAWIGAARYALQRQVAGDLADDPKLLAAFVARWNLRGMGVIESEIDRAIELAEQAVKASGLLKEG